MIGLVVANADGSLLLLAGLVVVLGLAVVIAHWASYRPPSAKRLVSSAVAACVVVTAGSPPTHAQDDESDDPGIVIQDPCKKYGPEHPMWWIAGCMWP